MHAYVFLDVDGNLQIRNWQYIQTENPNFFGDNRHWVVAMWEFDTEDEKNMTDVMEGFKRCQLPERTVRDFCKSIQFDLDEFIRKHQALKSQ